MFSEESGVFVVSYTDSDRDTQILGVYTTFENAHYALINHINTGEEMATIQKYELNSEKVTSTWTYHPIVSPVWKCTSKT